MLHLPHIRLLHPLAHCFLHPAPLHHLHPFHYRIHPPPHLHPLHYLLPHYLLLPLLLDRIHLLHYLLPHPLLPVHPPLHRIHPFRYSSKT
jgi:hypothetical protein